MQCQTILSKWSLFTVSNKKQNTTILKSNKKQTTDKQRKIKTKTKAKCKIMTEFSFFVFQQNKNQSISLLIGLSKHTIMHSK